MTAIDQSAFSNLSDGQLKVLEMLVKVKERRLEFALEDHLTKNGTHLDIGQTNLHVREWYESIAPMMVIMGAVQMLKSEFFIVDSFAMAYEGLSVLYILPKVEFRGQFVQNRIDNVVQRVDKYKKIIGQGFFDNQILKSFGKGVIKYIGSNIFSEFREFPADVIVCEEVDECNEGNLIYAVDRLDASPYKFKRYVGNPVAKNKGIHKMFMDGDQREYYTPCHACGKPNELDFFKTVVSVKKDASDNVLDFSLKDTTWKRDGDRDIELKCFDCNETIDRFDPLARYIPQNPSAKYPSWHPSQVFSPMVAISELLAIFEKGIHDPAIMKKFHNSNLGVCHALTSNRVTEDALDLCIIPGYYFVNNDTDNGDEAYIQAGHFPGPSSMGVDVGGLLDIKISAIGSNNERRAVYLGKIHPSIDYVIKLANRFGVRTIVVDAFPELALVEDLKKAGEEQNIEVWSCQWASTKNDGCEYDEERKRILIDRTAAMDRAFGFIKQRKLKLPVNYKTVLKGAFVSEMCMPVREEIETKKGIKIEWKKGKDHQRLTDVYDMLASQANEMAEINEVFVV